MQSQPPVLGPRHETVCLSYFDGQGADLISIAHSGFGDGGAVDLLMHAYPAVLF